MKKLITICAVIAVVAIGTSQAVIIEPNLGTTANFAVLAGAGITVAGAVNSTTINGDIGTFPTTSITGIGNVVLNGVNHAGDAVTQQAKNDLTIAYNTLAGLPFTTHYVVPTDIGGLTLTSGIYKFDSSAGVTGVLTLNGPGDFVFQMGSTLITESGSKVLLTGGANAGNVFWQVGSSATLKTGTAFKGSIIALTDITLNTGATIESGRALARDGAVTLDNNIITIPEPATLCLLGFGVLSLVRRKK